MNYRCPYCNYADRLGSFEIEDKQAIADLGCTYACPNCSAFLDFEELQEVFS